MTLRKTLSQLKQSLSKVSDHSKIEAEMLLEFATGKQKTVIYTEIDSELSQNESANLQKLLKKRLAGTPLAYLTGKKEFFGREFLVNKSVLIPRPETELLVENALKLIRNNEYKNVLEIGTGSGCISVTLAAEINEEINITAIDDSSATLKTAQQNAARHSVTQKLELKEADIFKFTTPEKYDIIVSNPPYIPQNELQDLPLEVKQEPISALDGGKDGLDFYRGIFRFAGEHLTKKGCVIVEVHSTLAEETKKTATSILGSGFEFSILSDYNGLKRILICR